MERDHVDRMLQAWTDRDPQLATEPLAVAGRILRLARFLDIAIARGLTPLGLSFEDFDVLNTLRREGGGPVRPSALARAALISSGAMTARMGRLQNRGLITRTGDDGDRRAVQVSLTADGEALATRALAAVLDADESVLAPMDAASRTAVADGLRTLLVPLEHSGTA
ncbi:MarR family winged helix-turn-helix transcriptional regulator [Tenggerimyces flavus]|uniref:MarR family winged helix-turn-helix transcriptional regulator n=1 Tax=Tenggerimyces flavus TaxID=1708749 RepID=A0ABV7YP56_9ACTN|nr:MarR family transcriptional regulator [Tenggerimyces flavus]MBM7790133.1 DNA-binding MarR family transcriptional regulator [Tenggerimyces flavus]